MLVLRPAPQHDRRIVARTSTPAMSTNLLCTSCNHKLLPQFTCEKKGAPHARRPLELDPQVRDCRPSVITFHRLETARTN